MTSNVGSSFSATGNNLIAEASSCIFSFGMRRLLIIIRSIYFHVLYFQFRYATCCDRLLIAIGSIFSLATGAGWPVMSIIFGDLTDTFVSGNLHIFNLYMPMD